MKVKFKDGVNEYANGEYHRKNDGKPFEVDSRFAKDVLIPSGYFAEVPQIMIDVDVTPKASKAKGDKK